MFVHNAKDTYADFEQVYREHQAVSLTEQSLGRVNCPDLFPFFVVAGQADGDVVSFMSETARTGGASSKSTAMPINMDDFEEDEC